MNAFRVSRFAVKILVKSSKQSKWQIRFSINELLLSEKFTLIKCLVAGLLKKMLCVLGCADNNSVLVQH